MLNFFFPFVNAAAQPKPEAEISPAPDTPRDPERATPDHGADLASPAPMSQPQAPRRTSGSSSATRARKPAGQTGTKKAAAGRHRTRRQPEGIEASTAGQGSALQQPAIDQAPQPSTLAEAAEPAPKTVGRGARVGRWVKSAHRRSASAPSLPAGQRWKRRLPRASW